MLHQLEEDGLVRSSWDTEGKGPARRLYQVTPEGVEYLHAWAINIRCTRERLDRFLAEYETYFQQKKGLDLSQAEVSEQVRAQVSPLADTAIRGLDSRSSAGAEHIGWHCRAADSHADRGAHWPYLFILPWWAKWRKRDRRG
jgi:DNA-binding PadR family transcriptional regulator